MPSIAVILPAAGRSVRFGRDKLAEMLGGASVFARSAGVFLDRLDKDVSCLVFVTTPGIDPRQCMTPDLIERLASDSPPPAGGARGGVSSFDRGVRRSIPPISPSPARGEGANTRILFVSGGTSRAESVLNGIRAVPEGIDFVAIHDAARPLVSDALIERIFAHAFEHGSAIPALPVKLTIKQAAGPLPAKVQQTLPRANLWEMQTPQVIRRADLLEAYAACPLPLDQITDDAQVLELAGKYVWLVAGEESNLKITTPQDLLLAEQLLARK